MLQYPLVGILCITHAKETLTATSLYSALPFCAKYNLVHVNYLKILLRRVLLYITRAALN